MSRILPPRVGEFTEKFGADLKRCREDLGLSQYTVGKKVGMARNNLFPYEAGKINLTMETMGTRQSVECAFSMLKRTIASSVRARSEVAAKNEALMIALIHNIRCLIHAVCKHGIERFIQPERKPLGSGFVQ